MKVSAAFKNLIMIVILMAMIASFDPVSARRKNRKGSSRIGGDNKGDETSSLMQTLRPHEPATTRSRRKNRPEMDHGALRTTAEAKVITQKRYLKKDWCKSKNVRQNIRTTDGCRGKIVNRFCYGHCNSFYIPNDIVVPGGSALIDSADFNDKYHRFCSFCMPSVEEVVSVRLRCNKGRKTVRRRMKRTASCSCISVPGLAEKLPAETELAPGSDNPATTATSPSSASEERTTSR